MVTNHLNTSGILVPLVCPSSPRIFYYYYYFIKILCYYFGFDDTTEGAIIAGGIHKQQSILLMRLLKTFLLLSTRIISSNPKLMSLLSSSLLQTMLQNILKQLYIFNFNNTIINLKLTFNTSRANISEEGKKLFHKFVAKYPFFLLLLPPSTIFWGPIDMSYNQRRERKVTELNNQQWGLLPSLWSSITPKYLCRALWTSYHYSLFASIIIVIIIVID